MQCVLEKTSAVTEYTSQWKCKFSWSVIGWGWLGGVRVDRSYLHCSTVCHLGLCALLNAVQILTIFCPTPSRILNLGPVLPQMLELGKIHTHTHTLSWVAQTILEFAALLPHRLKYLRLWTCVSRPGLAQLLLLEVVVVCLWVFVLFHGVFILAMRL